MLQNMLRRWEKWRRPPVPRGLHRSDQLRWVLERERARTDRSGGQFSLLTFALREAPATPESFQPLVAILQARLRCYDEIGFLDEKRLGVVLPDTPAAGGWKVADDVLAVYPTVLEPPQCEVYTYPSDWSADEEDDAALGGLWNAQDARPTRGMEPLFILRMPRWKRALDIFGAVAGLALFSPLLLATALAVRLSSRGPVIFRQWRAGEGNRRFLIYKFRTMYADAELRKRQFLEFNEQDGPAFKLRSDPRITDLGRLLRRTSIDELPQFWNVLKGDMSLVGPRPLPCDETDACLPWQKRRLDVTPGLTCIWQVKGRSRVSFDEWIRMDVQYIRSRTPAHDLKLLLQTMAAVVSRKGAY